MAEINATILIPDISGFTEFMSTTELSHSTHAINLLINAIVEAVGEEYEVSEIEGDAVLLIKKGPAPSQKEILDICLKIFNAFHFQRKWLQQHAICPCGACQSIINLSLKFVVHHGPLAEIKVGRFVKQSGTEMIVAHRLLKNSIDNNEYLLMTEKLLQQAADSPEDVEMEWVSSSEEYSSIGKIEFRFTLLNEARKNVPEPPEPQTYYRTDNTSYLEMPVAANFRDVYMAIMNIPGRPGWIPDLRKVEQDRPEVFIGSIHRCTFENYQAVISPLRMTLSDEGIIYAESCRIKEMNLSLVHEFVFKKINEKTCGFAVRFMNAGESPIPEKEKALLFEKMKQMAEKLKEYCEKVEVS
ncbi:MAG TPA: DUF2652 domain-containing protein [Bacteroidia bacterium]|nr:DUF2652 domain-containing protein [Bacteroidia bacterium]